VKVTAAAVFTFAALFFLDRNFRVLPNAIHEYMPQHHAGLVVTDVKITKCSKLNPFSSCALDPLVWYRIEKDLYLGKSITTSAYIHVQRKKEEELTADDSVVVDISVSNLDPGTSSKADVGERWESRTAGLWLKRSIKKHASDSDQAVTAVDVLFGDDAEEVRGGWKVTGRPLLLDAGSSVPSAQLTIRRGGHQEPTRPTPRINDNGKFKIIQLADLHLSTGIGACREAVPDSYNGGKCEADPRTMDFVSKILDEERPDLIVLSGDQVNGDTAPDAQSVSTSSTCHTVAETEDIPQAIFKYAKLLIDRKIPYVSIFGNHDDEGLAMSRQSQMSLIETLPYSLSSAGPEDIDGVGNYFIEVLARGGSSHSALTIYLLDSHAYSPDERHFKGYDWIKQNQIDWFKQKAQSLKRKHKEYTHIHMDVAFIHIPIPEMRDPELVRIGEWREAPTAPMFNSGFRDALVEEGVVMVSAGQ
jgi:hypothetical protein